MFSVCHALPWEGSKDEAKAISEEQISGSGQCDGDICRTHEVSETDRSADMRVTRRAGLLNLASLNSAFTSLADGLTVRGRPPSALSFKSQQPSLLLASLQLINGTGWKT